MTEHASATSQEQQPQSHEFQAEVQQLLDILVHSLYSHKEIFLRELLSNAVDALDKMRFEQLTLSSSDAASLPLEIRIECDETKGRLTMTDTGVGMTRDELVENIGTIARSGTARYLSHLSDEAKQDSNFIGQFGVGFYSVFMVAEKVRIITCSYRPDSVPVFWESDGRGTYTIAQHADSPRGTRIEIDLKKDENRFAKPQTIREIVQKHSNYVPYPIKLAGTAINEVSALWRRPKQEIAQEDYQEFYKFITGRTENPLSILHFSLDTPYQLHALLYVPPQTLDFMGLPEMRPTLSLYSRRVLIQRDCKELLPDYLHFLAGLVDVEDLPLNISREGFQRDRNLQLLQKLLTKKFLSHLQETAKKDSDLYSRFYRIFGHTLKQGFQTDFGNRDRIVPLLRFNSSTCDDDHLSVSLANYVQRMKDDQKEIFYLCGAHRESLLRSPHLEVFRAKEIEVLFLTDPMDDLVLTTLQTFQEKPFAAADQADLGLTVQEKDEEEEPLSSRARLDRLLVKMGKLLESRVVEVRQSKRLKKSPCALVNPQNSATAGIQKLMSLMDKEFQLSRRILEINGKHPIIRGLAQIHDKEPNAPVIEHAAHLLLDSAMLQEDLPVAPREMAPRLESVLEELTRLRAISGTTPPTP